MSGLRLRRGFGSKHPRRGAAWMLCVAVSCAAWVLAPRDVWARAQVEIAVDPPNPQVGEVITIRYTVRVFNESDVQITPLDFGRLELLGDMSPPQLPAMWGGGFMTIESSREYNARAPAPGRYVIRGGRVIQTATGRVIAQHPDVVVVVSGSGVVIAPTDDAGIPGDPSQGLMTPAPPPDPDAPPAGDLLGAEYNPTAFVRLAVDNPRPYVGQQIALRAWLYVASSEASCDVQREAQLTGFWNESLIPPSRECAVRWFPQTIGGRFMAAGLLRRVALFPTQTGRLSVGGMVVNVDVVTGGLFRTMQRMNATSPMIAIEAREPPTDGRPADFVVGTTGPITMEVTADRDQVAAGETVTYTVRATSDGSIASNAMVLPRNVDGVRIRSAVGASTRDQSSGRVITTVTTEILVVPERPGRLELGHVELPYWNPTMERYDTTRAALPVLTVTGTAVAREQAPTRTDPALELRPLVDRPSLRAHRAWMPSARTGVYVVVSPALLFFFALGGVSVARRVSRGARERRADQRNDPASILDEARRRVKSDPRGAISLAGRALDRALIVARDHQAEHDAALSDDVQSLLDEARHTCDAARFAGEAREVDEVIRVVERAVRALETAT